MLDKVDGLKTILTAILTILITLAGMVFGPVDIGTTHIPQIPIQLGILAILGSLQILFNAMKGNKIKKALAVLLEKNGNGGTK